MIAMSAHAITRAAQRNVSPEDIQYVMRFGTKEHRAGACFFYLGGKDIPVRDRRKDAFKRLEGTTIVLDASQKVIISVYRNRDSGLKCIRKKRAYRAECGMDFFQVLG